MNKSNLDNHKEFSNYINSKLEKLLRSFKIPKKYFGRDKEINKIRNHELIFNHKLKYYGVKTKDVDSGLVYAPFLIKEHDSESLKNYNQKMKQYEEKHKHCPKCGDDKNFTQTLAGYVLEDIETYQDLNNCICLTCGDKHTVHERN
jgi:hypothetical protein